MSQPDAREQRTKAILALPGLKRYEHFIKAVVDRERAWGLWADGGWALARLDDERVVMPLWPDRAFADLAAASEWSGYEPSEIPLQDLKGELLDKLEARGLGVSVFPTPEGDVVVPTLAQFRSHLIDEESKY
jgi:hypothetical protein